jgi:hypothetical protein
MKYAKYVTLAVAVSAYGVVVLTFIVVAPPGLGWWPIRVLYGLLGLGIVGCVFASPGWLVALGAILHMLLPVGSAITVGLWRYSHVQIANAQPASSTVGPEPQVGPLLVHISDTHFIGAARGKTYEGSIWDERNITWAAGQLERLRPGLLLISGDVTDTGAQEEWDQADAFFRAASKANIKIVVAPGTHDTQPAFTRSQGDWTGKAARFVRATCSPKTPPRGW